MEDEHEHSQLLFEQFKKARKKEKICCLFIDYIQQISLNNTINKEKLYRMLEEKNIPEDRGNTVSQGTVDRQMDFKCKGERF